MANYSPAHSQDTLSAESLEQPPEYEEHAEYVTEDDVHIATLEEKKRRWWRNALINATFIASWSAFAIL